MKAYLVVMLLLFALTIVGNIYRLRDGDRLSHPRTIFLGGVLGLVMFAWTVYLMWNL